ncbi:MAG: hypothetical protein POH28_05985 [Acidocella sp.]|nr:hypothetical protein [Acidocella sp.]
MRFFWLLALVCLPGCAARQPQATRIVTMSPILPGSMLQCAPAPSVPQASSQEAVAHYVVALWLAGQDCRAHVRAIAQVLEAPDNRVLEAPDNRVLEAPDNRVLEAPDTKG